MCTYARSYIPSRDANRHVLTRIAYFTPTRMTDACIYLTNARTCILHAAGALSEAYSRMTSMCYNKCIHRYKEADLQIGEMTCIDRCVGKYMDAQEICSLQFKKFEDMQRAQQEAAAKMGGGGMPTK